MSELRPIITKKAFKEHIRPIINNPLNAFIELIANAHDSGATELKITWPEKDNLDSINNSKKAIFEDNGHGMTYEEFIDIWPQLSYNRIIEQGSEVEIIGTRTKRSVYGRNGKGRHSPFSFSDEYEIKTIKDGTCSNFKIKGDEISFIIENISKKNTTDESGTTIKFSVIKNNVEIDIIKETLATRFLKDDSFTIYLNNEKIDLKDIDKNKINEFECEFNGENIKIIQLESSTQSKYDKYHGLSWKINNRLIEDKSWDNLIDGRRRISKKFNYIIYADILKEYVNETMTGFKKDDYVKEVKNAVYRCIKKSLHEVLEKKNNQDKEMIYKENLREIKKLSITNQDELSKFVNKVQEECPDIKFKDLKATTEIFIKLKQSKNGYSLLHKLSKIKPNDYDTLYEILDKWDVQTAKIVLDEIKWRLNVIEELKRKVDNPDTDELHELQPLFEKGLWIFGPEYESIDFTSNKQLVTVVQKLLKQKEVNVENPRLRPDFVALEDTTIGIYSSDKFNDNGEVEDIGKILIIELKKGGFKIDMDEVYQTEKYIKQFLDGGHINKNTRIDAYVLGSRVNIEERTIGSNKNKKIIPKQYNVILRKAESRLFNLEKKILENKQISRKSEDEILNKVLEQQTID